MDDSKLYFCHMLIFCYINGKSTVQGRKLLTDIDIKSCWILQMEIFHSPILINFILSLALNARIIQEIILLSRAI